MSIVEIKADLFKQDDVDALVNAVNCVGVMGKGIALQFKKTYPANFNVYKIACKAGQVRPGRMFIYDTGALVTPKYIINFPTKDHWGNDSRIEFIRDGLQDLIEQVKRLEITSIAIPRLGCSNGNLDWRRVKPLIEQAFSVIPDVEVRLIESLNEHSKINSVAGNVSESLVLKPHFPCSCEKIVQIPATV